MAAGLRIKPENIASFRSVFDRSVVEKTVDLEMAAEITIDRELKFKEIGIRKVLGAKAGGIVVLLSRDFSKGLFMSVIVAVISRV